MPEFTYYDETWVYNDLEAFQMAFLRRTLSSSLQRLDIIIALEKPPIKESDDDLAPTTAN